MKNSRYEKLKALAHKIIEENLGEKREIQGIENNNWVFTTTDNKKPYMVKFIPEKEETRLDVEIALYEFLGAQGDIKVPKIIKYGKESEERYLLRECIEGQTLDEELKICKEPKKLYSDAGKMLAKIHSIEFEDKGLINAKMKVDKHDLFSQKEYMGLIKTLFEKGVLKEEEFNKLEKINMKNYYDKKPNVLCHCDYGPNNIIAKDGEIVAVIDFEWACACPFMDDIVAFDLFATFDGDSQYLDHFYKGYMEVRAIPDYYFENLDFYKFYRLITMLAYQVKAHDEIFDEDYLKKMRQRLGELLIKFF